ncbi:junctophilin-1 [Protopterus annectens]|uniref:junctophilin-1 n=1 Tax=Protopterus annectens TaxID=7888 RepID=UPI001CF998D3|nr:junctophilin-1 [Protopterus annectens]XP_043923150.1 junctophilin-1 [Protopterus annectens]XP_043923151.1 junctophilin-1 [Protopterus annectens]XP_043923152.1 junctophilin-1 [Protopterus annectens]
MTGGRFDFDDGGTYCGGWEDGKAHGHGICTGPKGQGEYSGSWSHGFEVVGVYTWPSGNTYQGYWAQGKRHGLGVEAKGKWIYRGEWSHGFKGRYGVRQSISTPARYEGTWSNGLQDGYGVETYGDGGTYQGQWLGGMRHGYGVRQSVPYGMATVIRSPLRTSLASLRSEQSNGSVLHDTSTDSPAGTRGGFVLNFHSDSEVMTGKKKGLFRRGSLLGSLKMKKSESKSSISSKRSSVRSEATMSRISSSDANSTISYGDADCDYNPVEDHVDATTTETYMGEWKNDKRYGFGVSERSNGMKYEGEWMNNKRHGYGCTIFPDGSKEEGKYKNNVLVRGIRKQLIPIKNTKTKEKVERAVEGAQRAAAVARTKVEIAASRTAHARAKADAADQAAQAARQESDIARAIARELSPSFHQPGLDYIKQMFHDAVEVKEVPEQKVQEKVETPGKDSPHFYRKGTTPPNTPEESPPSSPIVPLPAEDKRKNFSSSRSASAELKSTSEMQTVIKPLPRKGSVKSEVAVKPPLKHSVSHNPISPGNGELHSQYHSYYVKAQTSLAREEPEYDSHDLSPSELARLVPTQKQTPGRSAASKSKALAKENEPEPKVKRMEMSAPKNKAQELLRDEEDASEMVQSNAGPNSIFIGMVMLLNIGLAILFVHFLT